MADGNSETVTTEACPFCGTRKPITRIGDHIFDRHREDLYRAVAMYEESN